ncbi:MAG: hypothetical protein K2P88_10420 [Chitinophagaceae bacterium]|nr:hypothetical protein [Chitinophagaceae bacterium]
MKSWGRHILLFTYLTLVFISNTWKGFHPFQENTPLYEFGYTVDLIEEGSKEADRNIPNQSASDTEIEHITVLVPLDQLPYEHFVEGTEIKYHLVGHWYLFPALDIKTPPPQA